MKVLRILYDDQTDGLPTEYQLEDLPKLEK